MGSVVESTSQDAIDALDTLDPSLLSPSLIAFPAEDRSSSSSGSSSQHSGSPRNDWVLPGTVWSQDSKFPVLDLSAFGAAWTGLDIDASMGSISDQPQLSIDPNALFQFSLASTEEAHRPLQLPTPRPGSASRSISPVPNAELDPAATIGPSAIDIFAQLGQRARDAANVTLAIPTERSQAPISPVSPVPPPPSKVAIPRLRPPNWVPVPPPTKSAIIPTHPTPPASIPASSPPIATQTVGKPVRPKTSHTTIERRYRTNLNARILALRRAVPALRILEKNSPTQTQGKGFTGATTKWNFDDDINERGYVDGVKAAKKNSKGVVLGKAVEYIRALKRREARLRREGEGLRSLVTGLVGGPELLREWEREWRARFGGEEADEVDEDEADADIDMDCDDGEDDSDDDSRAKKRVRTVSKPDTPPAEKRKRGRPRKHPAPAPIPVVPSFPPETQTQVTTFTSASTPKPLLALALIFSVFGPRSQSSSHTGSVLTAAPEAQVSSGWSALQILHIIVSVLLFFSLAWPYLSRDITRMLPHKFLFASPPLRREASAVRKESLLLRDERALRDTLGAKGGVSGVVRVILSRMFGLRLHGDLRAWRRVGELDVARGRAAPLLSRIQTYVALAAHSPSTPADSITLALLARTFAPSSAAAHWAAARRAENSTAVEKLVLEMDMDAAASVLAVAASSSEPDQPVPTAFSSSSISGSSSGSDSEEEDTLSSSPVHLIATQEVLTRAKALSSNMFVAIVTGAHLDVSSDAAAIRAVGRELGGEIAVLTRLLEHISRGPPDEALPFLKINQGLQDGDGGVEDVAAVRALLHATLLFRQAFPTSHPPTQDRAARLALRRALANSVFDESTEIEEARDQVVDMLAEAAGRG